MAYTQKDLQAVEAALASGATSVSYEGKNVSYRSLEDLIQLAAMIRRSLGLDPVKPKTLVAGFSTGYYPVDRRGQ